MQKNPSKTLKKATRQALLLCTTANISSEEKECLSRILAGGLDWEYLLNLAEFHNIVPLVAHNLATNGLHSQIPQPYLDQLKKVHSSTLYRNVLLATELTNILSAFNNRGIAAIPLKGTVLAEVLYENPALRTIADIDILVHPEDKPRASSLLTELGYKQLPKDAHWDHRFHDIPYCKEAAFPFYVELHWDMEDTRLATIPEQEIWSRSQLFKVQGISTRVLSPEDNLLFLSTHIYKHNDSLLKFLGDIAELLKKYRDTLDWSYIVISARSWQTDIVVYSAVRQAKELLGAPVPALILEALKPSLWRRLLLSFLINQEYFVTSIRQSKIRDWTAVLARGLMMKHTHQTLTVLSGQQGPWKRGAWLRTAYWVTMVFVATLARNGARVFFRQ